MLRHHFTLALRNLLQNRVFSAIHLLGLAVGMTICLLIGALVWHEFQFDQYQSNLNQIYRIGYQVIRQNNPERGYVTPYPTASALRLDFPEFEKIAQVHLGFESVMEADPTHRFKENRVLFAEPELFDILDFQVLSGNPREALVQPGHIFLSEKMARKYFGTPESAPGKTMKIDGVKNLAVAGVYRDLPATTHLPADMVVSFKTFDASLFNGIDPMDASMRASGATYVLLPANARPETFTARLQQFSNKYLKSSEWAPGEHRVLQLRPLRGSHFEIGWEDSDSSWGPPVSPAYLKLFGSIGLAVLLLACINFINLSTVQAIQRAKEIGVRKVLGAGVGQLKSQVLTETGLLTAAAGVLALGLAYTTLPLMNTLLEKNIASAVFSTPALFGGWLALIALTALLAGFYPAFVLASFRPALTLQSSGIVSDRHSAALRRGLVVFEFALATAFLVGTLVISQQMDYVRQADLGFNKAHTLFFSLPDPQRAAKFDAALRQIPGVQQASFAIGPPTGNANFTTNFAFPEHPEAGKNSLNVKCADANYASVYGLRLLAGRFLQPSDTLLSSERVPETQRRHYVVVNERVVKLLGAATPAEALGQKIQFGLNDIVAEIVGVVGDFHVSSLRDAIAPTLLYQFPMFYLTTGLRLQPGADVPRTVEAVRSAFLGVFPEHLFDYQFLDASLDQLYESEERLARLMQIFAGLAVLISCLGLFGLSSYAATQRSKEIGVRKVLGATVASVVGLLSIDFLKLVVAAIAVASPLAYWAMNHWLADFAYRIDIGWQVFAIAGILAVTVAFLTVSSQAVKAALANPAQSLKNE